METLKQLNVQQDQQVVFLLNIKMHLMMHYTLMVSMNQEKISHLPMLKIEKYIQNLLKKKFILLQTKKQKQILLKKK